MSETSRLTSSMEQDEEEWRTPERRRIMVGKIAEAMREYPGVVNRSPADIETTAYQEAQFEAQYNETVGNFLLSIRRQGQLQRGLSEYGKQETSTNISAAQLAAEPVFQTAEQSSQLPPTTHPLTVARGSSLHPSVVPLSDPYNMGGSSGTPSLPVSGFHIQPQGSMAAGGRMGMYSGMPSRATIPGGSGYVQQPIQQETRVWVGFLETTEILANNRSEPRQTPCSMFVSRPEIALEIKSQLWPTKLNMTLHPKSLFNAICAVIPINVNTVRAVHFQFGDNVQNVTMLRTLMISDPMQMQKKAIGIIQFSGQQPAMQQCPVKAFIMVWTQKSRQFSGLIHLDQKKFVQTLRQAMTQIARMQQMSLEHGLDHYQFFGGHRDTGGISRHLQQQLGQGGMQTGAGMQPGIPGGGMQAGGGEIPRGGMQAGGGMQPGIPGGGIKPWMPGGGMQPWIPGGGMQAGGGMQPGMPGGGMQLRMPGGGMQPGMPGGGMQLRMSGGGVQPGMPGGGMQPGMPGGGMQPGIPGGGMQPGMLGGGMQPGMPGSGMQPEMPGSGMQLRMPGGGMQLRMPGGGMQAGMPGGGMQPRMQGWQQSPGSIWPSLTPQHRDSLEHNMHQQQTLGARAQDPSRSIKTSKVFNDAFDAYSRPREVSTQSTSRIPLGYNELLSDEFVPESFGETDLVDADATHEAFQQEVGVCISNLVVSGSPGSGKTSVVTLSVGEPAPDVRNSTGCIETPVRAIARGTICANGTKLQKLQTEEMLHKVCQAMKHKVDEIKSNQCDIDQFQHEESSVATDQPSTDASSSISNDFQILTSPSNDVQISTDNVQISSSPSYTESSAGQDEDLQVFSKLIAEISSVEASTEFLTAHLVLTIDSGGQPHFMDVAPLFLRNSSLFLITVKLNERLDSKPKFNFFINGQAIEMSNTELQPTNLQLIEQLAKSISSLQLSTTASDGAESRHAKFMIVGTFADKADECQGESIANKNSILRDRLKDYEAERIDEGNDVIFAINAVTTDPDERQKAAVRLQDKIINTPGTAIKTKIKLRWFGLLLHLLDEAEKSGVPIIPLDDVLAAGRCLQMSNNEIRKAVAFFHELNLIMYFSTDKLGSIVFVDVKPILSNVSNLIGISFIDKDKLKKIFSPNLPADAQRLLRDYGTFSREILDSSFHFSAPLTTDVFLNLLEHLCVIARIQKDGQTSFFLPSALPHAPQDILREKEQISHIYTPWILVLQARRGTKLVNVPIPNGYLPTLAVHLLNSPKFEADLSTRQYRNLMSVLYVRGGRIYLIEKSLHLQIYFTWDNELTEDCFSIRFAILDALIKVEEKLHFIPGILIKKDAFLCSCDGSRQHVCVFNTQSNRASCNRCERPHQLNHKQLCWLMQPSEASAVLCSMKGLTSVGSTSAPERADLLNRPLRMRELMHKVASRVTDKWYMIGLELDIEQHQLNTIRQSSHQDAILCFSRVFELWQNQADPPFTWTTIVGVLRSPIVQENSLAKEIEDWLMREQ